MVRFPKVLIKIPKSIRKLLKKRSFLLLLPFFSWVALQLVMEIVRFRPQHNSVPPEGRMQINNEAARRYRIQDDTVTGTAAALKDAIEEAERGLNQEKEVETEDVNQDSTTTRQSDVPQGLGEMGEPVVLQYLNRFEEQKKEELYDEFGFNVYASDLVSLHRTLPDLRDEDCKIPGRYLSNLPQTSVIVCFYDEAWSILLRTVHSVLDRTPEHLLKEIILVDDFSYNSYLKEDLERYVSNLTKVKIIRAPEREGLIRCRITGAKAATAPVLTFLDSHCEVTTGWLEPLLDIIVKDRTSVAVPTVDTIDEQTLEIYGFSCNNVPIGGFNLKLAFSWHKIPPRLNELREPCDSVQTPIMSGGLFSIDKDYFQQIGYYDEKLDVWGGENLEMSFKVWMCGGSVLVAPCSHVGHMYRDFNPYARDATDLFGEYMKNNLARVARVWLDDQATIFFKATDGDIEEAAGDVTEQLELRRRLNCESFDWYLDNVYPEAFIPSKAVAIGEFRNLGEGGFCLDTMDRGNNEEAGVSQCYGGTPTQYWGLTRNGEIRCDESCLDYSGEDVMLMDCHGGQGNQYWVYTLEDHKLRHPSFNKCLGVNTEMEALEMLDCDSGQLTEWELQNLDEIKLKILYP